LKYGLNAYLKPFSSSCRLLAKKLKLQVELLGGHSPRSLKLKTKVLAKILHTNLKENFDGKKRTITKEKILIQKNKCGDETSPKRGGNGDETSP